MSSTGSADAPSPAAALPPNIQDGPYVLRSLLDNVPLSADDSQQDIQINCLTEVSAPDHNLYVGTSASELLHFVGIPPDPADGAGSFQYILASRLSPAYAEPAASRPGVQQILLLPRVGKACILCNWTVTFYSLPELSPVFGTTQVKNCNWIGGIDLNEPTIADDGTENNGVTIMLSLNRRIQVVRIGSDARVYKKIDFAGSTLSVRRDAIACVADSKSYALVDVDRQLKIPLMNISSLDETPSSEQMGHVQSLTADTGGGVQRSSSSVQNRPLASIQSHNRSASLGSSFIGNMRRQEPRRGDGDEPVFQDASTPQTMSPQPQADAIASPPPGDKPLPATPGASHSREQSVGAKSRSDVVALKPHITSPSPEEFLVVTGTDPLETGLGIFVNLDGDPTRPPLQFEQYPREIVVDGSPADLASSRSGSPEDEDGYVIASLALETDNGPHYGLEIQRWGVGGEVNPEKHWLEAYELDEARPYGIRALIGSEETQFDKIVERLCQRKFTPFSGTPEASSISLKSADSRTASSLERLSKEKELFDRNYDSPDDESLLEGWEATRNSEEEEFARRFAKAQSRIAVWAGNKIWWAIRNPLLIQLDSKLEAACLEGQQGVPSINREIILEVLTSIRDREPKNELEFLTFGYLRQKAGILLLTSLLRSPEEQEFSNVEMTALEEGLVGSKLDPRVVLSLIPGLRNEIIEGRRGIWIHGGVKKVADAFVRNGDFESKANNVVGTLEPRVKLFLRRFLTAWRKMKGFGSVPDENEVFRTVDAALLIILLELDQSAPKGLGKGGAVRSELYDVVDRGVECFDRAVDLLESYHRLFVLSRLYQSRKLSGDVLATWKRIIEGERDEGSEFRDGEQRVREYLTKISSQSLVQEYGIWLANRNPKLGVQVFTEDKGRAPKIEPAQAVEILREHAPNAVKYYLEHLVFDKGQSSYVNELITYYLDIVLGDLESSKERADIVMSMYEAYRALQAPKPTYSHFLTDNAPANDEVWQSRLRLLQLLGGSNEYDVAAIRGRIARLPDELLVPETIILAGRERHHEEALRLLVHRLGDYDTAVSYCLRGGSSIYTPQGGRRDSMPPVDQQRRLFHVILGEFLGIEDVSDRVEQTGALLERFGGWFEIDEVLGLIPDSWSVDIVAGFLVGALRRLIRQKHQSMITRALSGSENLRVSYDLVVKVDETGPTVEAPN
ncbi:Transforming growth factor-beta receptor-associated protein 1 [Paramyrothecium foliicola]|nr:Transforming growth factor-beta receptor-associated protein 1 [Paramyrothecium foliicola]